jgi:hypothetical protein
MRKFFLLLLLALVLILLWGSRAQAPVHSAAPQSIADKVVEKVVADVCHHAVTCGGVHDLAGYQKSTLPYNIWGYVQYRVGDKLYFTRQERMIPKGTVVWEDAYGHLVLDRCGNMVTTVAPLDAAPMTEPQDIFPPTPPEIASVPPTVDFPPDEPTPPSVLVPTPPDAPPSYPPSYPCCGYVPLKPPTTVPEPSTFLLTGMGILILMGWRVKSGRTERSRQNSGRV